MMKVSTTVFTLLISSPFAAAATNNKALLRGNDDRQLQFNVLDDIGSFLNEITGNFGEGIISNWGEFLDNNIWGGGTGMSFLEMMGGTDFIKDTINLDSMIETMAGLFQEALDNGNYEALPDGFNWESIIDGGFENVVNWTAIVEEIDLANLVESLDFEQLEDLINEANIFGDGAFNFSNIFNIDWSIDSSWQNLLTDVFKGIELSDIDIVWTDVNACEIIQLVNGIAPNFAINANCSCKGNLATGLGVGCGFSGCAFGKEGCAEVAFNMSLAEEAGSGLVDMNVCTTFGRDEFEEVCISYAFDQSNSGKPVQTCYAKYGEGSCQCSIDENSCAMIDCSAIREDAVMNECMPLGLMRSEADYVSFVPKFAMLASVNEEEVVSKNKKPMKKKNKKFKIVGMGKRKRTCKSVGKHIKRRNKEICDKKIKKSSKTVGEVCSKECE